jgi:hypothetical protein
MHTYLLARQGRSKEIDAVSILLQSVIISTGVRFRHLPPFQSPRSPPGPLFAVCVSQSLHCQACLQSGSPVLLCRALLAHWNLATATEIHVAHQKTSTGKTNPEQQRGCCESSLICPPAAIPPSFGSRRVQYMCNEEAMCKENKVGR